MKSKKEAADYKVKVHRAGNVSSHAFFTYKSARLFAKEKCNADGVRKISIAGPGIEPTTLYEDGKVHY